jgi:Phage integrase family
MLRRSFTMMPLGAATHPDANRQSGRDVAGADCGHGQPLVVNSPPSIIAVWLQGGRPEPFEGTRNVFLRIRAPHRALTSNRGQPGCFRRRAAGQGRRVFAHRLRHSAATGMLRAGASLPEIGQVLRHRRMLSTAIYAKTDVPSLRALARPWPCGGAA